MAALDGQLVAEPIRAIDQVLEVERAAVGAEGQALDPEHRCSFVDAEQGRRLAGGRDGFDGELRAAEVDGEVVLDDEEDVARGQVLDREATAHVDWQIALVDRDRQVVEEAQAPDPAHGGVVFEAELVGDVIGRRHLLERQELVSRRVAERRHGFVEAFERRDVLPCLGLAHVGALALDPEDQAFALQVAQRVSHRDAADIGAGR